MIGKYVQRRTAVFIDAANIYFAQKTLGWRVDFQQLINYFRQETNLTRIAYYTARNPDNEKEGKFHDFLEIIGYVVQSKKIKFIKDINRKQGGLHKGNVDVELTIDAVDLINQYDSYVLISGDGDFAALLVYLKSRGKRCGVMSTRNHIAKELIDQAKYIDFKRVRKEIERTNKNPGR